MRMRRIGAAVLLCGTLGLVMAMQGGCILAAAGAAAGTVAYVKGDLEADLNGDVPRVIEATKAAMNDLKLPIVESNSSSLEGYVEARIGADNKARIHVKAKSDKVSRVAIRVGTFGDEAQSNQIMDKIKANLK